MSYTITQTFNPSIGEYGQDYALPVGSPIYSPVSGTISTEDLGKSAWGKRVHVFLSAADATATGITSFAVGHLTKFAVSAGQHVKAGDLIGYSGGATSDPSSGNSSGPHVEPQFFNKKNQPLNPVGVFSRFSSWEDAIFKGLGGGGYNPLTGFAGPVGSTASGLDPLSGVAGAIGDFTAGFQSSVSDAQTLARRATWIVLGVVIVVIGIFLIIAGDLEKLFDAGLDQVDKVEEAVAPAAAVAA